ncbi:hypothetical protein FB451DRAFT_1371331 [Mycena latifolia]|nr:hypothetical protein FB451DRAFT_1371331 [Mycena latifolia]
MLSVALHLLVLAALGTQLITAAPVPVPDFLTVIAPLPPLTSGVAATLSASLVGVDAAHARTTYALAQDELAGAVGGSLSTIARATGTLVEGSDYLSYTFAISGGSTALTIGVAYALEGEDAVGNAIYTVTSGSAQLTPTTVPLAVLGSWVLDLPATSTSSQPMGASMPSGPQPTGNANSAPTTASVAVYGGCQWRRRRSLLRNSQSSGVAKKISA